jgi:hypothetical protein
MWDPNSSGKRVGFGIQHKNCTLIMSSKSTLAAGNTSSQAEPNHTTQVGGWGGPLVNNIYANPPTFMETLVECAQFIEKARHDTSSTKEDVLDSMENRLSLLIGKMASHPVCSAFKVDIIANLKPGEREPASLGS